MLYAGIEALWKRESDVYMSYKYSRRAEAGGIDVTNKKRFRMRTCAAKCCSVRRTFGLGRSCQRGSLPVRGDRAVSSKVDKRPNVPESRRIPRKLLDGV